MAGNAGVSAAAVAKRAKTAVALLAALLLAMSLAACAREGAGRPRAEFGAVHVTLEVARTEAQRRVGLAGHRPLGENEGMLFVFDGPSHAAFWMKGMTFPIDIVWIEQGRVVHLERNVPAPAPGAQDATLPILIPSQASTYVLEVAAGFADRHGITVGSAATLRGV